jgi:hypothetical protein
MVPALLLLLLACAAATWLTPSEARYTQSEYVLSGYLDPPLNDASYSALAAANFTGVFGDRTCVCTWLGD